MPKKDQEEFQLEDSDEQEIETEDGNSPEIGSAEWEDHVMQMFTEDELVEVKENKYPLLKGLRRVAHKIFGVPIKHGPVIVQSNLPYACVCSYELCYPDKVIGALADATENNVVGDYGIYLAAIAESRAETRAYRKLLMLSTPGAEEIKDNTDRGYESVLSTSEFKENDKISTQQIKIIESLSKKLKLDLTEVLKELKIDLKTATKKDGVKISKHLNSIQQKENLK